MGLQGTPPNAQPEIGAAIPSNTDRDLLRHLATTAEVLAKSAEVRLPTTDFQEAYCRTSLKLCENVTSNTQSWSLVAPKHMLAASEHRATPTRSRFTPNTANLLRTLPIQSDLSDSELLPILNIYSADSLRTKPSLRTAGYYRNDNGDCSSEINRVTHKICH